VGFKALLAWTIAEGRREAAGSAQMVAPEPSFSADVEKRRPGAQQTGVRRRPRVLPVALLAAAAATAALMGRVAHGFAAGAGAARPVPPAEAGTLVVGLEGLQAAHRPQRTAPHAARGWELPELTQAELRQLRRGLAVRRQELRGRRGFGLFVVDVRAPPAVVFQCLQSFESYPRMIPTVRGAEVRARVGLSSKGAFSARAHYKVSRFSLGVSVVHAVDPAAGTIDFDLDEACAKLVLQEAHGSWRVEPVPGVRRNESRVWLRIRLRASKLLPRWLLDYAAERALGRATSWLKPFMERSASQEFQSAPPCSLPALQLSRA